MRNFFIRNSYAILGMILILGFSYYACFYGILSATKCPQESKDHISDPIPLIVLDEKDGKNKEIIPAEDFLKAVCSDSNRCALTAEDFVAIAKLKREVDLGKVQIEMLKKMVEKKDSSETPLKKGWGKYLNYMKSLFYDPIISGVTTFVLTGITVSLVWYFYPSIIDLFLRYEGQETFPPHYPTKNDYLPDGTLKDYCNGGKCYPELCTEMPWWDRYLSGPQDCPKK